MHRDNFTFTFNSIYHNRTLILCSALWGPKSEACRFFQFEEETNILSVVNKIVKAASKAEQWIEVGSEVKQRDVLPNRK